MTNKFDDAAGTWDDNPHRRALAQSIVEAIQHEIVLTQEMQAIDFGAGTGLISFGLAGALGRIYALDPSAGMIAELKRKCTESGIANIIPVQAPSIAEADIPLPVDLVIAGMVFHHIQDVAATLSQLHDVLKPGGWLAIADLVSDQGEFHDDSEGVFHQGFAPSELSALLRDAGFQPSGSKVVHTVHKHRPFPVFLSLTRARPKHP